jgi:Uma2 family endonuclease
MSEPVGKGGDSPSSQDVLKFPHDHVRRELFNGELLVATTPTTRHQGVVSHLIYGLGQHPGRVYPPLTYVYLSDTDMVQPDVLYLRPENIGKVEDSFIRSAPDIVLEVCESETWRLDVRRKRNLYEKYRVPEYWIVELDADRVEVYRLEGDSYPTPTLFTRNATLTTPLIPGFALPVDDLLGPPED